MAEVGRLLEAQAVADMRLTGQSVYRSRALGLLHQALRQQASCGFAGHFFQCPVQVVDVHTQLVSVGLG